MRVSGGEPENATIKKSPDGFDFPTEAVGALQTDIADVFIAGSLENSRFLQASG